MVYLFIGLLYGVMLVWYALIALLQPVTTLIGLTQVSWHPPWTMQDIMCVRGWLESSTLVPLHVLQHPWGGLCGLGVLLLALVL